MHVLWPWLRRNDLGWRYDSLLGRQPTVVWIINNILVSKLPLKKNYDVHTNSGHVGAVILTLKIWTCVKIIIPLDHGQQLCETFKSNMTGVVAGIWILAICEPLPLRYGLVLRLWHTLWWRTTIVWNIQIQKGNKKLWPEKIWTDNVILVLQLVPQQAIGSTLH